MEARALAACRPFAATVSLPDGEGVLSWSFAGFSV